MVLPLSLNFPLVSAGLIYFPFLLNLFMEIFGRVLECISLYIVDVEGTSISSSVILSAICSGDR